MNNRDIFRHCGITQAIAHLLVWLGSSTQKYLILTNQKAKDTAQYWAIENLCSTYQYYNILLYFSSYMYV